jgi:predicted enzyme related to lactoylglutathione lyase
MLHTTKLDLYAGIPVADYTVAVAWYQQLLGSPPTSIPYDTEAVWEIAEHRYLYLWQQSEHTGHAVHLLFVDDLDDLMAQIAKRGLEPAVRETYSNGIQRAAYRDTDGNEIVFCGSPV